MHEAVQGIPVLVTGAAGFIGSHLVRRLIQDGAEVHAADHTHGEWARLTDLAGEYVAHQVDLGDEDATRSMLQKAGPVKVFHLASRVDVSRTVEMLEPACGELRAMLNLVRNLDVCPCDCFVQTGTCEEYGDNPVPFREDQLANPVSPYSAGKAAATMFAGMLHKALEIPTVVVRPFLTYGPGQNLERFIPSAIVAALREERYPMTGGEQTREFNHVRDIVDGFVRAGTTPGALGKVFNIGNGQEYGLRSVVEKISAIAEKPVLAEFGALPYRAGETWHFYCDNTQAREVLGWKPLTSLDEGLRETIDWYRKNAVETA